MISLDPLSGHSDPRLYVPLDTGERALAEISARLKQGQSPLLLTGPSGVGKTTLLRVLAEREWKSFPRVRFTPLLSFAPEDLSDWLLHLLFGKPTGGSPEAEDALLEELRALHNDPILLLVDNIQRTPKASVRKLSELAFAGRPGLAVIVAGTDDRAPNALAEAFAPEATVALPDSLPASEIEALYEAILAHPGLSPRLRHRLTGVEPDEITRAAAGIPRLLKRELVRRNESRRAPQREFPLAEKPRLAIVREPAEAQRFPAPPPLRPRPPRRAPSPRPAARAAAGRLAGPVAIIGRASGAVLGLLIGGCAFVLGVPLALAAALSHSGGFSRDSIAAALTRVRRETSPSAWGAATAVRSANDAVLCAASAGAARVSRATRAEVHRDRAALRSGGVALATAWRGALRVVSVAAVPTTAVLALALFSLGNYGIGTQSSSTGASAALLQNDVATPTSRLTPVAGAVSASTPVRVQVNARPWARVRINGVDVGPTPLSQRLAPGAYQFDAEFPGGERIQRRIDIGPKNRFVALP